MCDQVKIIISSKNRACQLDLLLRSLGKPCTVIYTHDEGFKAGYDLVIKRHPQVAFIEQHDYKAQLLAQLSDYFVLLCDDDVALAPFAFDAEFAEFQKNEDVICLSLRLCPQYRPDLVVSRKWRWWRQRQDWGYPMSVTSHVFRTKDVLEVMQGGEFLYPNQLEDLLRGRHPSNKPWMMCGDKPYVINNLANQVQTKWVYPTLKIPVEWLEEQFVAGKQIVLSKIREQAQFRIHPTRPFMKARYEFEPCSQ